jgi:hypothetical protein
LANTSAGPPSSPATTGSSSFSLPKPNADLTEWPTTTTGPHRPAEVAPVTLEQIRDVAARILNHLAPS